MMDFTLAKPTGLPRPFYKASRAEYRQPDLYLCRCRRQPRRYLDGIADRLLMSAAADRRLVERIRPERRDHRARDVGRDFPSCHYREPEAQCVTGRMLSEVKLLWKSWRHWRLRREVRHK